MTDTTAKNPFEYRTTPKNNWELIWWAVTDRNKVREYVAKFELTKKESRLHFLRIYFFYLVPLVCASIFILWFIYISLIAITDLPNITPSEWWEKDILADWVEIPNFLSKLNYLFFKNIGITFSNLFAGLAFVLISGLFFGLEGLGLSLGLSLAFSLSSSIFSFFIGLFYTLALISLFGLLESFILALCTSLILAFSESLFDGLGIFLGSFTTLIFFFTKSHFSRLDNNLYILLEGINLSLFAEKRFIKQSQENPELALDFVDFLLSYRRKNYNLAVLLTHTATATLWKEAALNLDEKRLVLRNFKVRGFTLSETWQPKLTEIKSKLLTAEQTTQISIKKDLFIGFIKELEDFRQSLLIPRQLTWRDKISMTRRIDWQKYYREAIEEWIKIAKQKLEEYEEIAKRTEPISRNFYLTGDALIPNRNDTVFMNRTDLHNELTLKIHTTNSIAVLFLQGQRRVGKTSLVKFLPKILGRRFEVVSLDLQGNITSVEDFLFKLRREFNTKFSLTEKTDWEIPQNWATALHELYEYIGNHAKEKDIKIILAIDEYEYLQQHLSKDLAQAQEFLGALRHFSQHQDHISLMFVGLKFFSELQSPNWNEYFVNAVPIRVDYFNQEESFKLIEVSNLDFEEGAKEKIFALTQGHPALIQKICYEIVNIANTKGSKNIVWSDVEKALKVMVYVSVNGVTDIFWTQTCELPEDKEVVWAILEKREIPKTHRLRLRRLIEYGFILENEEENSYTLRVPIFEKWVKKFG